MVGLGPCLWNWKSGLWRRSTPTHVPRSPGWRLGSLSWMGRDKSLRKSRGCMLLFWVVRHQGSSVGQFGLTGGGFGRLNVPLPGRVDWAKGEGTQVAEVGDGESQRSPALSFLRQGTKKSINQLDVKNNNGTRIKIKWSLSVFCFTYCQTVCLDQTKGFCEFSKQKWGGSTLFCIF